MHWRSGAGILSLAVAGLLTATGCSAFRTHAYSPDAFRAEVAKRIPDISVDEVIVPFALDSDARERIRRAVGKQRGRHAKVLALTAALSDPRHLGLRYRWAATADAQRTIAAGYGNCLSLSSVVVGAARTLGLRAYYVDVEGVPMRYRAQRFSISAGHIAALVHTERGNVIVDTFPRSSAEMRYRRLDDLQALAHFYNNRAYERMHEAQEKGDPIPWKEVWRNFELATRVDPELADAWNNLGIAYAHLGSLSGAESCYRAAIRIDPRLTSAYLNLAGVLLRRGEREAALRNLRAAEKLDPDNPSIDYGRCLVRASRRMAEAAAASHACEGLLNESARPLAVR